jgi:hypothetical protein
MSASSPEAPGAGADGSVHKDLRPYQLNELTSGDVIEFADINELVAFEDMVAQAIDPTCAKAWASRRHLRDLIRPPKFNGTIADIKLIPGPRRV